MPTTDTPTTNTPDAALAVLRAMRDGSTLHRVRLSEYGTPSHQQPHRTYLQHPPRTRLADDTIDPRTVTLLEQRGLIEVSFESWVLVVYDLTGAGRAVVEAGG